MTFRNAPLPKCISRGSDGGPVWITQIGRSLAGNEQRVARRSNSLRRFNVAYRVRRLDDLDEIRDHFEVMEGQLYSFPYRDKLDYKSGRPNQTPTKDDQLIGVGDGAETDFQLIKTRTISGFSKARNITLPDSGSVLIALDGVLQTETTHYTIDYATGIVTFVSPPAGGSPPAQITAGYTYRVVVRYDIADFNQVYEGFRVGSLSIPLIEVVA